MATPDGAVADAPPDAELEDGGGQASQYAVTQDGLERFIKYQERTLVLYAQMLDELGRADVPADAGTGAGAVARVKKHAEAQESVRRELGLSARDVRELERIVGDVISRRSVANAAEEDESIRQMQALAAKLPEEQRAEFEATIKLLREQQAQTRSLAQERAEYGDGNVDLVLSHEAELTRQWNEAISTFAGTQQKRPAARGEKDAGVPDLIADGGRGARAADDGGLGDGGR